MRNAREEILRFVIETEGEKDLKSTAKSIDGIGKAAANADPEAKKLVEDIERIGKDKQTIQSFVKLKAELTDTGTKLSSAKAELERLRGEMGKSETVSKSLQRSFNAAEKEVDRLTKAENRQSVELQKLTGALSKAGIDTNKLADADRRLNDEAQKVAQRMREFAAGASAAGKGAREASDGVDKLNKSTKDAKQESDGLLGSLGKITVLAAGIGAALKGVQLGAGAFGGAVEIEKSLARVQALAEGATDRVAQLSTKIHDAAREAKVGPEAAAQALAALAGQGQNIDQAFDSLIPTLRLAKIASIEVGQAAGYVDDVLDLFGLSAKEAGKAVDVLVTAAKGSDEGLAGLLGALSKIAPTARDAGLSFEQTAGILGVFVQNGFSAEKAAKGLLKIFDDLRDPTSDLRQNLADLGDNSGDFATGINTLAQAGDKGKKTLDAMDASARNLVLFLLQQGDDAIGNFTKSLQNVEGAASKIATAIDNNLGSAFTNMQAAFDNLATQFLQPILAPLKDEIEIVSKAVDEFSKTEAFKNLQNALVQFVKTGLAALNEFVAQIDFNKVAENLANFGTNASTFFTEFRDDIEEVARFAGNVLNSIGILFDGAATTVHFAATVIAGALGGILKVAATLAELDIGDQLNEQFTGAASAATKLDAVANGLLESAKTNWEQTGKSASSLTENFNQLVAALDSGKPSAEGAASAIAGIGTVAGALPEQILGATTGVGALGVAVTELEATVQPAAQSFQDLGTMVVTAETSLKEARNRVRETRDALAELQTSAEATPEALAKANAEFQAATANLRKMEEALKGNKAASDELKQAYDTLKIVSQQTLVENSAKAVKALDSVVQAQRRGAAETEDVRRAFVAASEAQLAAARDSDRATKARVENEIRLKAAALGVVDTLEKLGLAGKKAGDDVASGANKATAALAETAATADKAADSAANLGEQSNVAADGLDRVATSGQAAGESAIAAGEGFANAAQSILGLDRVTFNLLDEQTRRFNEELAAVTAANDKYDERKQLVNQLAASYNLLNAAQIEQLATARLEQQQNQQRAQQQEQERRQREQSTTTNSSSSGGVSRIALDLNVTGAGSLNIEELKKNKQLGEAVARELLPHISKLIERGVRFPGR